MAGASHRGAARRWGSVALRSRPHAVQPPLARPTITVRRLRPGDDRLLAELAERNADFSAIDDGHDLEPLSANESVTFLADDRTATFVAFVGDEVVGFCYALELYRRHSALRHLCIYEVGVSSRHRNIGVGPALVEAVGDHARAQGITRGFAITHKSNPAAMGLFEGSGGVRTSDDDVVFGFTWVG